MSIKRYITLLENISEDTYPYGWWLQPNGQLIEVDTWNHGGVASAHFKSSTDSGSIYMALAKGWIKMSVHRFSCRGVGCMALNTELRVTPTSAQLRLLSNLSEGFTTFYVDSLTIHERFETRRDFINFLRTFNKGTIEVS